MENIIGSLAFRIVLTISLIRKIVFEPKYFLQAEYGDDADYALETRFTFESEKTGVIDDSHIVTTTV